MTEVMPQSSTRPRQEVPNAYGMKFELTWPVPAVGPMDLERSAAIGGTAKYGYSLAWCCWCLGSERTKDLVRFLWPRQVEYRHLIGPTFFPVYVLVLKVAVAIAFVVTAGFAV